MSSESWDLHDEIRKRGKVKKGREEEKIVKVKKKKKELQLERRKEDKETEKWQWILERSITEIKVKFCLQSILFVKYTSYVMIKKQILA